MKSKEKEEKHIHLCKKIVYITKIKSMSTNFIIYFYDCRCDVSSSENIAKLAEKVKNEVGEVSILVNNAGIMPCKTMMTHSEAEIKKIFDINVFAHFWVTKFTCIMIFQ